MWSTTTSSRAIGAVTTRTGGVGMGLSIADSVIQAHGGHMSLSDADNGGLRVEFVLPR